MIRFANNNDIPYLKAIWRVCFDDTDLYIESYYINRPLDAQALVWEEDGNIVASLDLIPISLKLNGTKYNALYIYAAATLPKYRKQGIMHKLIDEAARWGLENDYHFLSLIPQTESLVSFYKNQGFSLPVYRDLISISRNGIGEHENVCFCSEENFQNKKQEYEKGFSNAVVHDTSFRSCLYRQTLAGGGSVLSVGSRYAICYLSKDKKLFIQEISSNDDTLFSDVSAICSYFYTDSATIARKGTNNLYGLFRPLTSLKWDLSDVYMNTMLD